MKLFKFSHYILISLFLINLPANAYIESAYRIHIKGLGTIILLGDQQDPKPETDQEQFDLLADFLKALAQAEVPTVVNLETLYPGPEYYTDADSRNSMIRNRLSEREIAPNLRAFVTALKESDLNKKIHFVSSDPRHSALWSITRNTQLKSLVEQALKKDKTHAADATFLAAEQDHEHILKKYHRFLERSKTNMSFPLYRALEKNLKDRLLEARRAHKTCRAFFHKYSDPTQSLAQQTIQTIIYNYAIQKFGTHAIYFNERTPEKQNQVIQVVTASFLQKIQKKFSADHASCMINAPWVMDLFNAFTHRGAQTAVFYASDSHIHYLTLFLRSLQKELRDDTITFQAEFTLAHEPLSREQFGKIFDVES